MFKGKNMVIAEQAFTIYFGDKQTSWNPLSFVEAVNDNRSLLNELQHHINEHILTTESVIALRYIHSANGYVIKSNEDVATLNNMQHSGDYLITSLRNTGLIVATADCLPLVLYDPKSNTIGIAHCGAVGSLHGIARNMMREFCDNYNSKVVDLQAYLGPCAKVCCYEVKEDFIKKLNTHDLVAIRQKDGKSFFDLPLYNIKALELLGIKKESIHSTYNHCTICSPALCSFRRDGLTTKSQLNIVMLF